MNKSQFTRQVLAYLEDAEKEKRNCDSWYVCKFPDETLVIQGSIYKCINDLRRGSTPFNDLFHSLINDCFSSKESPLFTVEYICKHQAFITEVNSKNIISNPYLVTENSKDKTKIKCWQCFEETVGFKGAVCDTCYEERKKTEQREKTCTRILSKGPCRGEVCGRKPVGKDGLCLRCNRCVIITSSLETILETEDNN